MKKEKTPCKECKHSKDKMCLLWEEEWYGTVFCSDFEKDKVESKLK